MPEKCSFGAYGGNIETGLFFFTLVQPCYVTRILANTGLTRIAQGLVSIDRPSDEIAPFSERNSTISPLSIQSDCFMRDYEWQIQDRSAPSGLSDLGPYFRKKTSILRLNTEVC